MTDRFDVLSPRSYVTANGETKSYFVKIGTAWPMQNGNGFSITLDALPLPSLGDQGKLETRVLMMPPKPRDDAPARTTRKGAQPTDFSDLNSDPIPF